MSRATSASASTPVPAPEILRGWEAIAKRVGLDPKTARKLATFPQENRLPVYKDHIGVVATGSEIDTWKRDQVRPYSSRPFGERRRPGVRR